MAEPRPIIPDLILTLLDLHQSHGSAVVRVERRKEKKQLVVRLGSLAFAESNVPEDHLARVLVRMHLLPKTALPTITGLMQQGKTTEEAVQSVARTEEKDLDLALREQAVSVLASLLAWDSATFHSFRADGTPRRKSNLRMPLPELLILAARRAASTRQVPTNLRNLAGVLTPPASPHPSLRYMPLDNLEALALSMVTGPARVGDLAPLFPAGVEAEEIFLRLILVGLTQMKAPAPMSEVEARRSEGYPEMEELLARFEAASYYEILSVPADAAEPEIKDAYHELARQYHPDRFQSRQCSPAQRKLAEDLFTHVARAYTTLSDPDERIAYDAARLQRSAGREGAAQPRSGVEADREKRAEAIYRGGKIALAKGDFENAVQQFKECIWLLPNVARYHFSLGAAQAEIAGMQKEAELRLQRAIELDGALIDAYLTLGKLYLKVNLLRRAESQFLKVLTWDSDNKEAKKLLAALGKGGSRA